MIRHIALLQIKSRIPDEEIKAMISQLEQAALTVPGMVAFCGGAKQPGSGMSQGFTHVINIDFVDAASRDIYLSELDRDRMGIRVSEMTEGGLGGILTINIDIDDIRMRPSGHDRKPELRWI